MLHPFLKGLNGQGLHPTIYLLPFSSHLATTVLDSTASRS